MPDNETPAIVTVDNVLQAISAASRELGVVRKTAPEQGGVRYATLREDAVLDAVHPLMAKYDLVIAPTNVESVQRGIIPAAKQDSSGQQFTLAIFTFDITHVGSGTAITVKVLAEGADVGGQGAAKAQTSAMKTALRQTFRVRVENPGGGQRGAPSGGNQRPAANSPGPAKTATSDSRNNVSEFWAACREARISNQEVNHALRGRRLDTMTRDELVELYESLNDPIG